jgi:hypothetical protein
MRILIFLLLFSTATQAQVLDDRLKDSTITLQLTQRMAAWVAKGISITADTRKQPDALKNFVGSGNNPDSLFTITAKAGLIRAGLELLLTRPLLLTIADYNSIILNSPAIPGYTSLKNQVVSKANGNTSEKQVAIWLRDWYLERESHFAGQYEIEKQRVIKLVQ